MFYSKSTKGFYAIEIHGDSMPSDVVEISDEEHQALLASQSVGKEIIADEDGFPIAVDIPAPTSQELQAQINAEARAYLASTDWYVIRFKETGASIPDSILVNRADARTKVIE